MKTVDDMIAETNLFVSKRLKRHTLATPVGQNCVTTTKTAFMNPKTKCLIENLNLLNAVNKSLNNIK